MPETTPTTNPAAEEAARRLEDIARHLTAAGLPARLHHTRHSTYLTATTSGPRGEVETTLDDDSYCEISFWLTADATPARIATVIDSAVTAITGRGWPAPNPGARCPAR